MSFSEEKRDLVKKYILHKIALDEVDFISKAQEIAGSSITTIKNYLKEFISLGQIIADDSNKCGYSLVTHEREFSCSITKNTDESMIYYEAIRPVLDGDIDISDNVRHIIDYASLEMINNAIEHSHGNNINISIITDPVYVSIIITDDGIGIFNSVESYFNENNIDSMIDPITELYKGKITTKPDNHSGEGIFFTSKMVSDFCIISDDLVLAGGVGQRRRLESSHLVKYFTLLQRIGTMVMIRVDKNITTTATEVFNKYSSDEGFIKTHIPVQLICGSLGPLSRSQARKICYRLEEFSEAFIDFDGVEDMGQGFSDEIFRVYAKAHPDIILRPINANANVVRMIKHVARGDLLKNIVL